MPSYPNSIYSPRVKENGAGVIYDPTNKTIGYMEDIVYLDNEVVAIETELGSLPKATSASVSERLKGIRSLSDANSDVLVIKGGNVGVGTANPGSQMHLYQNIDTSATSTANYTGGLTIENAYNTVGQYSALRFKTYMNDYIYEKAFSNGDNNADLVFGKYNSSHGLSTDILTLKEGGNVGIGTTTPTVKLDINSDILRLRTAKTPATAGAAGNAGDICWDANFIYICVSTNAWKRVAIATW